MLAVGIVCLCAGFGAGVCLIRVKTRWCPQCGVSLACPQAHAHQGAARVEG